MELKRCFWFYWNHGPRHDYEPDG